MKTKTTTKAATRSAIVALTALAQESRLAIFKLLVKAGPDGVPASKISEDLAIPASSLSFHLKELTHANLITPLQQGRFIIYSANFNEMTKLIEFLTENCCGQPASASCCAPGKS